MSLNVSLKILNLCLIAYKEKKQIYVKNIVNDHKETCFLKRSASDRHLECKF